MHPTEIELLNRYAAAELAGSLLVGKRARMADDPFLIARLTYHCMDEARHAWLWTNFMEKKSIPIRPTHSSSRSKDDYFSYMSETKGIVDFLAAIHVYELRLPFHFTCHSEVSFMDPDLKKLMLQIRDDEKYHIGWVKEYLEKLQAEGDTEVAEAVQRAGELEERTYFAYVQFLKTQDDYSKEFAAIMEKNLPSYPFEWKNFLSKNANA